jgi:cell division protease FtsH
MRSREAKLPKPAGPLGGPEQKSWPVWLPWVLVILFGLAVVAAFLAGRPRADTLDYATFLERAAAGQVREATFTNGTGRIAGTFADGKRFTTSGPAQLPIEDRTSLRATTLRFRNPSRSVWDGPAGLFAPMLGFVLLLGLMARRNASGTQMGPMGQIMSVGKSRAKLWTTEKPRTNFADVAGYDGVKVELREIVDALTDPSRFADVGARTPRGVLLVGPPGTGKTLLARAVAGEAGVPFLSVTGSDFMEMFVGVGASRVRDLFQTARVNAPCIMFIDEIDGVGRKRGAGLGGGHDEREQTLNQLLSEMDGFDSAANVVVLAATNRPDVLDPALLRPGRFDRQVVVPLPDLRERLPILRVHAAHRRLAPNVDLETIARGTPGMSGADLANLVNEAALCAVRRRAGAIEESDFETARDRLLLGQQRESLVLSERDRELTAYHEAGHALLAELLADADPVHKVTIIPRGMALGVTMQLPTDDRHSYSESMLLDRLCVMFGGRAAERLVFGHLTTGASNDLVSATQLARRMVREWGMSTTIGPMAWGSGQQVFLGDDLMKPRDYADDTSRRIDVDTESILRDQEGRALQLLTKNRRTLTAIAKELLALETIHRDDILRLMNTSAPK